MLPKRYRAVHWIDGMKVSKEHFIATDCHLSHALREARAVGLSPHSFGLCAIGGEDVLQADIQTASDRALRVQCALENGEVRIPGDFVLTSATVNSHAGL